MGQAPTVFVVDDEESVRLGLQSMLSTAGFPVEAFPHAEAFLQTYNIERPGCAILDVRMPGMDGMQLQKYLLDHRILLPVIMLSGHGDVPMAVEAMENGAITFLQKPALPDVLIERVRSALQQDTESRRKVNESQDVQRNYDSLTPREKEVLEHLIQGKSTDAVSRALGTSETTIRVQRSSIRKKMHADTTTDLLRMMMMIRDADQITV